MCILASIGSPALGSSESGSPVGAANGVEPSSLYLEVFINDQPTRLIAAFEQYAGGRIGAKASELTELGLKPPSAAGPDDIVILNDLAGLRFSYDAEKQTLNIVTGDELRLTTLYDVRGDEAYRADVSDFGGVVNYSLFAAADNHLKFSEPAFEGVSGLLDGRIFGRHGTIAASGIISTDADHAVDELRLETSWTYSDQETLTRYRVGDTISSGPLWSRPIRMGGAQVQRNFSLRPSLVTLPLPAVSGSTAVPSTVDIYVNNVKSHSQAVGTGPFTISNIPAISGAGEVQMVVRDASGREVRTTGSFISSAHLLRQGLFDFSAEAGFARINFGTQSNDYADEPIAAASARYGVSDRLTLEGHAEAARDLVLAGGGATGTIADRVLVSAAGSASFNTSGHGYLLYGSLDTEISGIRLAASSQRTFGHYYDLATITAVDASDAAKLLGSIVSGAEFPRALDRVTAGVPLTEMGASFNVSYLHIDTRSRAATHLLSATYSQRLFSNMSFYATAFADLEDIAAPSVFVGLTIPLGGHSHVSTGFSRDRITGPQFTTTYARALKPAPGSIGWRLRDSEGHTALRAGAVSYRGAKAQGEVTVSQIDDDVTGTVVVEGAVAVAGGGVFLTNRIDDAFAVVDVGAPDVDVQFENRPVGRTDAQGRLLVPGLRSYQKNKIAIDPKNLPVNASVPTTKAFVVPADRSAVTVKFGVETTTRSAVVILTDANGRDLPVASTGTIAETGAEFVIGYGGRAFIENLAERNTVRVALDGEACSAVFAFQAEQDAQVEIGPLVCR